MSKQLGPRMRITFPAAIPDASREIRISVGGASPFVNVAAALEFSKGQRGVERPEVVSVPVDSSICASCSDSVYQHPEHDWEISLDTKATQLLESRRHLSSR